MGFDPNFWECTSGPKGWRLRSMREPGEGEGKLGGTHRFNPAEWQITADMTFCRIATSHRWVLKNYLT